MVLDLRVHPALDVILCANQAAHPEWFEAFQHVPAELSSVDELARGRWLLTKTHSALGRHCAQILAHPQTVDLANAFLEPVYAATAVAA